MKTKHILTVLTITVFSVISTFSYGQCCGQGKCSHGNQGTKTNESDTTTGNLGVDNELADYSCPMHPEIISDKPGQCSKCSMDLVKTKQAAVLYQCPMKCEGEKTYNEKGKCPKCGMDLKEKKEKKAVKKEEPKN